MYKYMFVCSICGHHMECAKKEDWHIEKTQHKKTGCQLQKAPHKNGYVLARPQLAFEANKGKEIVESEQLELPLENDSCPA